MKRITSRNFSNILEVNRSLIKGTHDPTEVFVFMGHPIDSYFGAAAREKMALHSLSTGEMHNVRMEGDEAYYLVETEADVLQDPKNPTVLDPGSFQSILNRIEKVFK